MLEAILLVGYDEEKRKGIADSMETAVTQIHQTYHQVEKFHSLVKALQAKQDGEDRLRFLSQQTEVQLGLGEFYRRYPKMQERMESATVQERVAFCSLLALGQQEVFYSNVSADEALLRFDRLLEHLVNIDKFYNSIGGIVGYHAALLQLLVEQDQGQSSPEKEIHYAVPPMISLLEEGESSAESQIDQAMVDGIRTLPKLAEIYPIGGSGDRLGLVEEGTGRPLPAACLPFMGKTLLEGLIRDLQAREFLYHRLFHEQVTTPLALMTSEDKKNHREITAILEGHHWFGRPKESFHLFIQGLAPVITQEGKWSLKAPLELNLKPGGHGVLWKEMKDQGVFTWLAEHQRTKALVRQINNPIAGTDYGLAAFTGIGTTYDKAFGFAACQREVGAAEGVDVLFDRQAPEGRAYGLTNIEYTDFAKRGMEETPSDAHYSRFPSNTNILFVDLPQVAQAVDHCMLPGMLINFKQTAPYTDSQGETRQVPAGRLESTMQNLAECFTTTSKDLPSWNDLPTFVTYNERSKTISVTKNAYQGGSLKETPEGCYLDVVNNARDLLVNHCGMEAPPLVSEEVYMKAGPNLHITYHPALGPFYQVIAQKIRGGWLANGSELQLEIAELDCDHLALDGSLIIQTTDPLGHSEKTRGDHPLIYSDHNGKCTLDHVTVINRGIDRLADNVYWKNTIQRKESLEILIEGNGEFYAKDITIRGAHQIRVPHNCRVTAQEKDGKLLIVQEPLKGPTWRWEYLLTTESQAPPPAILESVEERELHKEEIAKGSETPEGPDKEKRLRSTEKLTQSSSPRPILLRKQFSE